MGLFTGLVKGIASIGKAAVGSFIKSTPVGAIASAGLDALSQGVSDSQNFSNQLALQQQGQQWQEHIIDKQNQWNSAPAQADRYREAGINPVMALGGGQSGIVSSGGSSGVNNSIPISDSVAVSNEQRMFDLQNRIGDADIKEKEASAARSSAEADTENKSRVLKLISLAKNNNLIDAKAAKESAQSLVFGEEASFLKATQTPRREVEFTKMNQEVYRSLQIFADAQIAQFNVSVAGTRFKAELANAYAQIALAAKQGSMFDAMASAQKASSYLQTVLGNNQNYSDEQREQILEATVKQIRSAAEMAGIDTKYREFQIIMDQVTNALGQALGLTLIGKGVKALGTGSKVIQGFHK